MITVRRSVVIQRPAEDVAAQFANVRHHERHAIHRGVVFRVVAEDTDWCDYEQCSRVGPVRVRQRFLLDRRDPTHQINTVTEGSFQGGTLTFLIHREAGVGTEVSALLRAPSAALLAPARPLLAAALGRSLAHALEEDRDDLERGHWSQSGRPTAGSSR